MGALKAVKAEIIKVSKPKFMVSGKSGIGKTLYSLNFPNPYFIDTEGGAIRKQYQTKLISSQGAYFGKDQGSQDFSTVIEEIKSLSVQKHSYKTLVIDSFSHLYNTAAAIAEERIGNDYNRDKKEANRPSRQLLRWLEALDMTVILICHQKDKWEKRGKETINSGTTFDGFDKLEYILDLWIEIQKTGTKRTFIVKKTRIESFPEGQEFPLDYQTFSELYGKEIIEKESTVVKLINTDQIAEIKHFTGVMNIPKDEQEKWLGRAEVDNFDELTEEQADKILKFLKKKIGG